MYGVLEYCAMDPITQVSGVVMVFDMGGFGFQHLRICTPKLIRSWGGILQVSNLYQMDL